MKRWRIGSLSMGIFLIFLGITLFVGQFDREISRVLLRNWWPLLLVVLGGELLLSNYLLNKHETKFSFDVLSVIFVGLIGLVSLGVYTLQSAGIWDRLTELASGRSYRVEHRVSIRPRGPVDKVVLDGSGFWGGTIRVWDSPDERVTVKVGGQVYGAAVRRRSGAELAPAVTVEQIGRIVHVRLRQLRADAPWSPRPDEIDVLLPPRYRVETITEQDLDLRNFHGSVIKLSKLATDELPQRLGDERARIENAAELIRLRAELKRREADLLTHREQEGIKREIERIKQEIARFEEAAGID